MKPNKDERVRLSKLRRWVNAKRNFPQNTCPASRHVQLMAESLARFGKYDMLQEEPAHCAESMFATVGSLYGERSKVVELKARIAMLEKIIVSRGAPAAKRRKKR